jgi:outer membrane protein W
MKNEKTRILFVILVVIIASQCFGSMTRRTTLGYATDFYVLDSYNIWTFPSTIVLFPKMAAIESMNGNKLNSGGIHMPLSQTLTGGAYLKNDTRQIQFAQPVTGANGLPDPAARTAAHQADLFLGHHGGSYGLGMHISLYRNSTSVEGNNVDAKTSQSAIGITLGTSFFISKKSQLDAALALNIASYNNEPIPAPFTAYDGKGNLSISFAVRYFNSISATTAIVPFAGIGIQGAGFAGTVSLLGNNIAGSYIEKSTNYILGISSNYVPNERVLVIMAIGYVRSSSTIDAESNNVTLNSPTDTYQSLPFLNLALESRPYNWLAARFGIYELLERSSVDVPNGSKTSSTGHDYVPNFGITFYLKRFTVDVLVNQDFLHHGPYLLSGHTYSPLFSQVSFTYAIP